MTSVSPSVGPAGIARQPLIRFLSSIWFGVAVLAVTLVYSTIISALPPVRWTLEMTEMQAYRHGLFVALVILFVLSLLTATLTRTRWTVINAGSIAAHVGLLVLAGGALTYFSTKVEGDVLLEAPRIEVQAKIGDQTRAVGDFAAVKGEQWSRTLPYRDQPIRVTVMAVHDAEAEAGTGATLRVEDGVGPARELRLSAGPDGWQPLDEVLSARVRSSPPQNCFYDHEIPALYFRDAAGREVMRRVDRLPIYYEHYLPEGGLLKNSAGVDVPPQRVRPEIRIGNLTLPTGWCEPWRMPIDVDARALPFDVRITGYAPFVVGLDPRTSVPVLALPEERRVDVAARGMSAVRLELRGRGSQADQCVVRWCLFTLYPDVDSRAQQVTPPGADGPWDIRFSRLRHDLNAQISARALSVRYFPGERGVQSYHSDVLVKPADDAVRAALVETNRTYTVGRWTLYQSGFAEDRWSYSILGVGNRLGMFPMNIGWIVVTLGCLYAFYVKPVLLRRATQALLLGLLALVVVNVPACKKDEAPYEASVAAAKLDAQLDWSAARRIAVQDGGRYKTLDSFARESFADLTGKEHLPGLSPAASLFEWLFHRDAYLDVPLVKVRSPGLAAHLARSLPEKDRERIVTGRRFTLREIFAPAVLQVLREMESQPEKRSAVNRVRNAQAVADRLGEFLAIVPQPGADAVAAWCTPDEVFANLSDEQLQQLGLTRQDLPAAARAPVPGLTPEQALSVVVGWTSLRMAWLKGDAAGVQRYAEELAARLPTLAAAGVYPARSQLAAEARYYTAGKFTYGWVFYFLALLVSIVALVTGWRTPWVATLLLLLPALAIHVYGLALRWYILGRIPVANMFEAVVASAALGVTVVLVLELFLHTRVFLVGASATGFLALLMGQFVLPGSELGTIPAILDDVQLRLHTVMIITAYALIFLAAVIAAVYLLGFYGVWLRRALRSDEPTAGRRPHGASGGPADAGIAYEDQGVTAALAVRRERPLLAGAAPGDEGPRGDLPEWLNNLDWSHLIVLNMVFVLLFVGGIILGAWWADYSWGRPWGWDPKEVFALNTWIIYAILLHVRFVVRRRGLWTAWLSLAGCAMMGFNWFFVNFFINSVHSYA